MTTIPVFWLSLHKDILARGYWDQAMLEDLFANKLWDTGYEFEHHEIDGTEPLDVEGGIIVIPARHHADDIDQIADLTRPMQWRIIILTGDEENTFFIRLLQNAIPEPHCFWEMSPDPKSSSFRWGYRFLGSGYTPQTREHLPNKAPAKPLDWMFAGQVTHKRREQMAEQLREMEDGRLVETEGFTEGLEPKKYFKEISLASVVPCPAGPVSPDSFRLFEALEAGCVPIADNKSEQRSEGFWELVFGQRPPFPVIDEWEHLPEVMADTLTNWPYLVNRTQAFWRWYKKRLAIQMRDDIHALSGIAPAKPLTTVLIPTSWIPSHPDTVIIKETVDSIREQLPNVPILIMIDGMRKSQEAHRPEYDEYIRNLLWHTNHHWTNVLPILFGRHLHQANMLRQTLKHVETDTILFVEHDTPLHGEIPWVQLTEIIRSKKANLIRLLHESKVLDPHQYLMLDRKPLNIDGIPLIRTVQFSARPHLVSKQFYERILKDYFGKQSRVFVEDCYHGIVQSAWHDHGMKGWQKHRLWIYAPDGDMKRSWHTDGRKDEEKGEQIFAYDGPVPDGAPQPGVRVD